VTTVEIKPSAMLIYPCGSSMKLTGSSYRPLPGVPARRVAPSPRHPAEFAPPRHACESAPSRWCRDRRRHQQASGCRTSATCQATATDHPPDSHQLTIRTAHRINFPLQQTRAPARQPFRSSTEDEGAGWASRPYAGARELPPRAHSACTTRQGSAGPGRNLVLHRPPK